MPDKNLTPISYRQYFKALIKMLKRNVYPVLLNTYISPEQFILYFAIRRKEKDDWNPWIVIYYPKTRKVSINNSLNDPSPTIIDAATFLYMDENKIKA